MEVCFESFWKIMMLLVVCGPMDGSMMENFLSAKKNDQRRRLGVLQKNHQNSDVYSYSSTVLVVYRCE